jgi:hypothetical protein
MDDLLKEAIADAKAVRETALENAKIALEEAFTPRLQSMLSKKIQSEIEVEEGEHEDDEDVDERMHGDEEDDMDEKMRLKADDEDPTDKDSNEAMHDEEEDDDVEERMHGEEEDDDVEERMHDEDEDEDDVDEELDLESVLKELEASIEEDDDVEEGARMEDEDEEEKDESVDENDVSSEIGAADNKLNKKAIDSTDIGKANKAKFESKEQVEEEIDLDEVLKALTEEDEEEAVEEVNEVSKLQAELDEHRDVVKYLRGKLNEVNLLNAKLLFTNKLFRGFGLSNDQKMKVVETFDRATNLREVKLVYSTLVESFKTNQPEKIKESKGSASKPVASTKSEKQEILSEGSELRDRFKKLAGITKFNS